MRPDYFKRLQAIKRQMIDDICATIPCQLGHAGPAYNSPRVLVTAYNFIWLLSLAAKCAMDRLEEGGRVQESLDSQQTDETCDDFSVARS
jgi:hypothetical protein